MTPTQPKFIDMPFAYNGARNEIPATGGDDGSATLNDGFPTVTEQPVAQGGIPPRRKDFNGILYALSNFQFFAQAGGIFTYSEEIDYRTPAMVWHGGNLYICIKNNGASSTVVTPGTNSDYWKDFVDFLGIDTTVAQKLGTATVGSGTKPIYLNAGSPVASSSTVGNSSTPVYLNAGTITACSSISAITQQSLGTTGYVVFSNGLVLNWARLDGGNSKSVVTYTKPIAYNTYVALAVDRNDGTDDEHTVPLWISGSSTTTSDTFETERYTNLFNVLIIGRTV